ncbi:MAG: PAS and ANTAR domain-containing protein [Mycolicibacterium sp.]|nr:PAS and ANTAR domain-containing protein [Mycolicibacterium sp.]
MWRARGLRSQRPAQPSSTDVLRPQDGPDAGPDTTTSRQVFQRTGSFRFLFADQRWEWSPEVERMHGYGPGEVMPTTELVLSHKHPDDHSHVAATLEEVVRTGKPFSARHRIIDVQGEVHDVIVVGDRLHDDDGAVIGTDGYYVDVTPDRRAHQQSVTDAVAEITENRVGIEQAKAMLMLVYHIDAQAAFDLLKWRSQANNVKLRALGEQIVTDFLSLAYTDVLPPRSSYDQLLLTAHERVKDVG